MTGYIVAAFLLAFMGGCVAGYFYCLHAKKSLFSSQEIMLRALKDILSEDHKVVFTDPYAPLPAQSDVYEMGRNIE